MLTKQSGGAKREPLTIMVVDDTPANLVLLQEMLQIEKYRVLAFPRGSLALKATETQVPDLILLDITMPEMDGFEVIQRLKADERLKNIPVIFISALADNNFKLRAFTEGAVDYITKPFQMEEVHARVGSHLRLSQAQNELKKYNEQLENIVQEKVKQISGTQMALIEAMANLVECKDGDTHQHVARTKNVCRIIAAALREKPEYAAVVTERFCENIHDASPLHDIGKVAIPDSILLKQGKLTPEEFEIMKTHSAAGANCLKIVLERDKQNDFVAMCVDIARSHHEWWNGTGYPDGLSGENIPLAARIVAFADVYDALRSRRPYKDPRTHEESIDIIEKESGEHFDPALTKIFLEKGKEIQQAFGG
ncbi:MAG: response regulator [Spirochaetota bacterium]|jgi:putative two-component system response regulator|nr:response regulator [Spirochaetota bacterium]